MVLLKDLDRALPLKMPHKLTIFSPTLALPLLVPTWRSVLKAQVLKSRQNDLFLT